MRFFKKFATKQKNTSTSRDKFFRNKLFTFSNFYNSKLSLNISFICYHFMTTEIKTLLLKPVSIDAGLMDPCNQFTSNDIESGNFIIKHGINFR